MKAKTKAKVKKQKRSYEKDTIKRISYIITTDVKHISKMLVKLQNDVDALREIAKKK